MTTIELTARDYRQMFQKPTVVFNSVDFSELNAARADEIRYMAVMADNGSPVCGLTLGRRGERFFAPFSAPFASIDINRAHRSSAIIEAVKSICNSYRRLTLTLPPPPYAESLTAQLQLAVIAAGGRRAYDDWNFHIDLTRPYEQQLTAAARSTLRQSRREGFAMERGEIARVYEIIRLNHEHRGYPMRMSLDQVMATAGPDGVVEADFFVLTDGERDAAAAMVYHTSADVTQVIYWGDVPQCPCRNAMNLLAAELVEHYTRQGMRALDIGPASSDGVADRGLCDFKSSIGCICTIKPTLEVDL